MRENRTLWGYAATRILDTPFWGIYNLIPFILYKDLGATPFQVAFLIMLKPLVSLLSLYWSNHVRGRPDRLVNNILWARGLAYAPFFLVPFVDSPWYFIGLYGFYMMLSVGIIPAWMEILKMNLPKETREKTFAYTQAFGYLGVGLFSFILGELLDGYVEAWRWLFPVCAGIGLSALVFQQRMSVKSPIVIETLPVPLMEKIAEPWKETLKLLKERVDFRNYQIGFMFVGSGVMILQPALPLFFVDILKLSYTDLSLAVTLCKGVGFALSSPWWAKAINRTDIFRFSSLIAAIACLFPVCLILAETELIWLWIGYLLYGFSQAGNELCWNMSGPIFSRDKDSSLFSSVNVVAIGLRGAIIPALGSMVIVWSSITSAMLMGGLGCLLGALLLSFFGRQHATEKQSV